MCAAPKKCFVLFLVFATAVFLRLSWLATFPFTEKPAADAQLFTNNVLSGSTSKQQVYVVGVLTCKPRLDKARAIVSQFTTLSSVVATPFVAFVFHGDEQLPEPWQYDSLSQSLVVKAPDDYMNLPYKVYVFIKASISLFPTAHGIFKVDDDVHLSVPDIYPLLVKHSTTHYFGSCGSRSCGGSAPSDKFCRNAWIWTKADEVRAYNMAKHLAFIVPNIYFCGGPAYYISQRAARIVVSEKSTFKQLDPATLLSFAVNGEVRVVPYEDLAVAYALSKHRILPFDEHDLSDAFKWHYMHRNDFCTHGIQEKSNRFYAMHGRETEPECPRFMLVTGATFMSFLWSFMQAFQYALYAGTDMLFDDKNDRHSVYLAVLKKWYIFEEIAERPLSFLSSVERKFDSLDRIFHEPHEDRCRVLYMPLHSHAILTEDTIASLQCPFSTKTTCPPSRDSVVHVAVYDTIGGALLTRALKTLESALRGCFYSISYLSSHDKLVPPNDHRISHAAFVNFHDPTEAEEFSEHACTIFSADVLVVLGQTLHSNVFTPHQIVLYDGISYDAMSGNLKSHTLSFELRNGTLDEGSMLNMKSSLLSRLVVLGRTKCCQSRDH